MEPAIPNTIPSHVQEAPSPIEVDGEEVYEIAEILNSKIGRCYHRCPLRYYVRWYGYEGTDDEFAWVAADDVQAEELIEGFHRHYPTKPNADNIP